MVSKLFTTVCVLIVMIECLIEARQNPSENQSAHSHRQRRSPQMYEKMKSLFGASAYKKPEEKKHDDYHHSSKMFDAASLIKSTFYTIFQLAKAIGGAATAVSGKLIKVGGYGISYTGKLIAATGDPITALGKKIALSAKLLQPKGHESQHDHHETHHGHLESTYSYDGSTNFSPNQLVELNYPHDTAGFVAGPSIQQQWPSVNDIYTNQLSNIHNTIPYYPYGMQPWNDFANQKTKPEKIEGEKKCHD